MLPTEGRDTKSPWFYVIVLFSEEKIRLNFSLIQSTSNAFEFEIQAHSKVCKLPFFSKTPSELTPKTLVQSTDGVHSTKWNVIVQFFPEYHFGLESRMEQCLYWITRECATISFSWNLIIHGILRFFTSNKNRKVCLNFDSSA